MGSKKDMLGCKTLKTVKGHGECKDQVLVQLMEYRKMSGRYKTG